MFVVLAFQVGGAVGTESLTNEESGVGDSAKAAKVLNDATPEAVGEMVLVSNTKLKATDPRFKAVIGDVVERLERTSGVTEVVSPYDARASRSISDDGHLAMVSFEVPGEYTTASVKAIVDKTVAQTAAADKAAGAGYIVEQFGDGSSEEALDKVFADDMKKATMLSLPVTLLILVIAFGTLVAAGLPLLTAITGVMATLGLVGPISQLSPLDDSINHVILLIGLAVGVDYALFYLRRMREERAKGLDADAAIEVAAATSGRAVLVSGFTVVTAMAGMYLAGAPTFTSLATGSILVVLVSMVGSLTVLPAMLSKLGHRVDKGRVPGLGVLRRGVMRLNMWPRVVDRVMKRPLLAAVVSTALLVAMAVPAAGLDVGSPAIGDSLPQDEPVVQTFNRVTDAFPAETAAMTVVVKAKDVTAKSVQDGIAKLEQATAGEPKLFPKGLPEAEISPDKTVASFDVESAGESMDSTANKALDALRDDLIPATVGTVDGVQAYVGGDTADDRDFTDVMTSNLPYVFGFVILAAFLLLMVTFRSIVVPIKAIVLNLLSVFASYGVLVLIFQHGWFKSLLGFSETGPITSWLPMFLFVILFGLSMDYHVFILSRVKELVDRGMSTDNAVSEAIKSSAGVVTSAAMVMVGVFALFGTLSFIMFKQMGVGLAFAVLLDATLIRGVLLPASMKLLGERNWWLPKRLQWLPKVSLEREVQPAGA
ncbi:MAG TPA: MMPL family transporter [Solirubrobacteraceae bacterium]